MTQLAMVVVETVVDGVEMGVLADGTAYLTMSGLAAICGVARSSIIEQVQNWRDGNRTSAFAKHLIKSGFTGDRLSIELNPTRHAVTDAICVATLGYYALKGDNPTATNNLYVLAREGLAKFIYRSTGYTPSAVLPPALRNFYDRLMLSQVPTGYYSVERELAEFLLRAIQAGLPFDDHTVPDISVGKRWSSEWKAANLEATFGARVQCDHYYPNSYPQAASNPHDICAYPIKSLGVFRAWLDEHYIPTMLPKYLDTKIKQKVIERDEAARLVAAVTPHALPPST